ncbi:MAG TPA: hypothetical protein VM733_14005 [Thermoanaerobaculia bacterium]|nr:hypothetical protein [Thermoanaerobaculia bacterium]
MRKAALAVVIAAALVSLHRGLPLGWDELEFFRATKWVSEGRVPFRDFWEHHTPLQWIAFAPVARFIDSPGADALIAMRWAQAFVWIAIFALVLRIGRAEARPTSNELNVGWASARPDAARIWALVLLLAAPLFLRSAIEYRVDVLGHLGFIAALLCALRGKWIAYGALMSLAVLANMRLAPLVVITSLVFLFWSEERWRFNPRALRMAIGVAAVAIALFAVLEATHAREAFLLGVVRYNVVSSRLFAGLAVSTLGEQLLLPALKLDAAAMAMWIAAIAGCVIAFRERRMQIIAIVFLASVVTVAMLEVQYEYHWILSYLLMVPPAALAIERIGRWWWIAPAVAAVGVVTTFATMTYEPLRYQDYVMREVDRRTRPDEKVFDGSAYALRREPAYRYWFLPIGIRQLAAAKSIGGYDIAAHPPAAIVYNLRMQRWFEIFPKTAAFAVHNYVPLTRDLWVPGLSAILPPGRTLTWTAQRDGAYTLYASEPLARHPWLTQPLQYAAIQGPLATRYAIPLRQLPNARVRWSVDGRSVQLRKGMRVTVASYDTQPVGVIIAPSDLSALCTAPGEEFPF